MDTLTPDRKKHITELFQKDAKVILDDISVSINKLDRKYGCIKRNKIVNYIIKKIK